MIIVEQVWRIRCSDCGYQSLRETPPPPGTLPGMDVKCPACAVGVSVYEEAATRRQL